MKTVRALFIIWLAFSAVMTGVSAQELAEEEIRGVAGEDVEFSNYEGPHEKIETAEEIRSIGESLSSALGGAAEGRADYFQKYSVTRIAPAEDSDLYGADILSINENSIVDHIDNVRRILSGYIQQVFDYSKDEADTIAVFLSFYNAVHRADMEYIERTYHEGVVEALVPEKAGIATRYSDWPGNTQMLIPLRIVGGEQALSTDTVGEEEVVEKMRDQEDRGVEERKDMAEIRDRELEEEEQATEEKKGQLAEQEQKVEEKQEEVSRAEEQLQQVQEEEGEESPEAQKAEQELAQAEEELAEEQQKAEEQREKIEEEEKTQEDRREDIQEEREKIAEDQQEIIEEKEAEEAEAAAAPEEAPETLPFILFEDETEVFGRLVKVERGSGEIQRRSKLNTIRSKSMVMGSDGVIVVAGSDDPPRTVRLVEISSESLETVRQSREDIYAGSTLEEHNGSIYAVTKNEGGWYVGRFDMQLELGARSAEEVAPQTMLLFQNGELYVQSSASEVILLDPKTLRR